MIKISNLYVQGFLMKMTVEQINNVIGLAKENCNYLWSIVILMYSVKMIILKWSKCLKIILINSIVY